MFFYIGKKEAHELPVSMLVLAKSLGCAVVAHFEKGRVIGWKMQEEIKMETGKKYVARLLNYAINPPNENGNIEVRGVFQVVGGPFDGVPVRYYKPRTPKTAEYINRAFRACGWKGGKKRPPMSELKELVLIEVQQGDAYTNKKTGKTMAGTFEVAFVNPLGSGKPEVNEGEADAFFADLSGVAPSSSTDEGVDFDPETGEVVVTKPARAAVHGSSSGAVTT